MVNPPRILKPIAALCGLLLAATSCSPPSNPEASYWRPAQGQQWQVQLDGGLDSSVEADVYEVDGVDTTDQDLRAAKASGAHLVCYFNAGAWEDWRPDADQFPRSVLGEALEGWDGERWLDVRRRDVVVPIMAKRMEACKERGFDAVDPDNVNGHSNQTGFPLSRTDEITYLRELSRMAHELGLAFGLKNSADLLDVLEPEVDFAVNEQCHEFDECEAYGPFLRAGKPVIVIEYTERDASLCGQAPEGMGILFKTIALTAEGESC